MSLSTTKLNIQNTVIVMALGFLFATASVGFFTPDLLTGTDDKLTGFQETILDNSVILTIVVIAGAVAAIKLDKRDDQMKEMIASLISALSLSKPAENTE